MPLQILSLAIFCKRKCVGITYEHFFFLFPSTSPVWGAGKSTRQAGEPTPSSQTLNDGALPMQLRVLAVTACLPDGHSWGIHLSLRRSVLGHCSKVQLTVGNQQPPPPGQQFPITTGLFSVPQVVFSRDDVSKTITSSVHSSFSPPSSSSACMGRRAVSNSRAERVDAGASSCRADYRTILICFKC